MSDWLTRWNAALREQHRMLFDYDERTIKAEFALEVNCPVCGMNYPMPWLEKDWFRWSRCRNCSMVYMNPRMTNEATHNFYNSEANAIYNESKFDQVTSTSVFDDRANTENLQQVDEFQGYKKGNLLEIGSGNGHFLKKAKDLGYHVRGLELNRRNCEFSKQLLLDDHAVLDKDLLDAKFDGGMFDVIYMRDLIQHIPNPKEFLRECHRVADDGCALFIGTHNIDGLIARVVKSRYTPVFGFMEPNHYSPTSITRVLREAGFNVKKINYESIDCTLGEILGYQIAPTFTTVFPPPVSRWKRFFLKLILMPLLIQPLNKLDQLILPTLANVMRRGSWMNVIAVKQ